ncbi:MAG TPA: hypothetical protein VGF15_01410 [Solirubrobacteraceae bacterium]|jgi:hypothetical protein
MKRPVRIALIVLGVVLFLGISGLLSRFLSVENAERQDDLALLEAQAHGDVAGMLRQLSGCAQHLACVASVRANAGHLRTAGTVKILDLGSATAYSLTGSTGKTRVAWTIIGKLPVVQCVLVKRTGNFLSGISVHLLAVSAPIPKEGDC